jgi:hypothetical protein
MMTELRNEDECKEIQNTLLTAVVSTSLLQRIGKVFGP